MKKLNFMYGYKNEMSKTAFFDGLIKSPKTVMPAGAGIHNIFNLLVSGLHRNDDTGPGFLRFHLFLIVHNIL